MRIFVDLDQTLIDYDSATRQAVESFTSTEPRWSRCEPKSVADAWLKSRREYLLDGSRSLSDQRHHRLSAIAARFGVSCNSSLINQWVEIITAEAISRCKRYNDVDAFLDRVRIAAIITNGDPHVQRAKLIAAGMPANSPIITSIDIGHAKPSPELYRLAAEQVATHPKQCLMIGDSHTHDHDAALAAGFAGAAIVDRSLTPAAGTHPTLLDAINYLEGLLL